MPTNKKPKQYREKIIRLSHHNTLKIERLSSRFSISAASLTNIFLDQIDEQKLQNPHLIREIWTNDA